jgi:hypothetical protein
MAKGAMASKGRHQAIIHMAQPLNQAPPSLALIMKQLAKENLAITRKEVLKLKESMLGGSIWEVPSMAKPWA